MSGVTHSSGDMASSSTTPPASGDMGPASTTCGPSGVTCAKWQACTGSGQCTLDASSRWDVWTAGTFYFSDDASGKPDPYAVCNRYGAELGRTNVATSSDSGGWYIEVICPDVSAAELMQGTVTITVWDHNTIGSDDIMGHVDALLAPDFATAAAGKPVSKTISGGANSGSVQLQLKAR
jgi:hypothetical protein